MKRILAISVALVMLFALATLTACGGDPPPPPELPGAPPDAPTPPPEPDAPPEDPPEAPAEGGVTEIILVNNKIEIDGALRAFSDLYYERTGIRVDIRSFGGETPYAPALASMINAGTEPEIFVFEGLAGWEDARAEGRITDLSNEVWVSDTDVAFIDPIDGNVVGFPVAIEGWGLGYNRAILAQAGIDSSTLTNVNAIREAFETIYEMKDELGLTAVVSMAAGSGMTWVTGLHGVNAYLTLGLPFETPETERYIDMLLNGEVDHDRLTAWAEYYNMLFEFANPTTLLVGGYDDQLGDFAFGDTAFIHQGNWIDPWLEDNGIDIDVGYIPHAFLEIDTPGIFVGPASFYLVNARAAGVQEAKDFLTFMATTPEGHRYMAVEAGAVAPFNSVTYQPPGPFSRAVQEWVAVGGMYSWRQNDMPSGFGMEVLGPIFEELAARRIDVPQFVQLVTAAVEEIR